MKYALETKKIGRKFGKKWAVQDVSLKIETGQIYGLLGPNGAGKTTTIKMLVGLLKPSSGGASVLGLDLEGATNDIRLNIGAALQDASLDDNQTGAELLELQARLYGLRKAEIKQRMADITGLVDIGDALHDRVKTYSGGMKRRIDLAASLMHNPKILFLDEPTTGLDPISRQKVWKQIRELNEELDVTIILTTQYLEEADLLADRIGIINEGQIIEEDSPKNLKKRIGNDVISVTTNQDISDSVQEKIKGLRGINKIMADGKSITISTSDSSKIIADVVKTLSARKSEIEDISVRQPTLDDVFLAVTGNGAKS